MSLGERLRLARLACPDRALRQSGAAAKAIGISRQSLYLYESDQRDVPLPVLYAAASRYGVTVEALKTGEGFSVDPPKHYDLIFDQDFASKPPRPRAEESKLKPPFVPHENAANAPLATEAPGGRSASPRTSSVSTTPQQPAGRTFGSEAERISYALGVLDMAGTSNRLAIESANEVSRAISAAAAALIAPVRAPAAGDAVGPTVEELAAQHRRVTEAQQAAPPSPAAAPAAPATAGRSGPGRRRPR